MLHEAGVNTFTRPRCFLDFRTRLQVNIIDLKKKKKHPGLKHLSLAESSIVFTARQHFDESSFVVIKSFYTTESLIFLGNSQLLTCQVWRPAQPHDEH